MGLFGKKREKVIDFSERYGMSNRKTSIQSVPSRRARSSSNNSNSSDSYADLGFVGAIANNSNSVSTSDNISWDNEPSSSSETVGEFSQKKQKLAKRLLGMTDKIEDLTNQIYHLTQRIEVLEKKARVNYE